MNVKRRFDPFWLVIGVLVVVGAASFFSLDVEGRRLLTSMFWNGLKNVWPAMIIIPILLFLILANEGRRLRTGSRCPTCGQVIPDEQPSGRPVSELPGTQPQ